MVIIYRKINGAKDAYYKAYDRTLKAWNISVEELYVETSFGKTHILVSGPEDAKPLFLFHGYAFSSTMWIDNIKQLSENYRVYAVDFVGDINKSEAYRPINNKRECADWFLEILDQLGITKAVVGGHSYGGFISLVLAGYVPERVHKVIAMSPAASFQPQSVIFFIKCFLAGLFPTTKRLYHLMEYMTGKDCKINKTLKDQFVTAMQNALPRNKLFPSYLRDDELKAIRCPVLLLIGDQDIQYNPIKAIDRARKVLSHVKAHLIKNTGHGLPMERPDQINPILLSFLDE